MTQEPLERVLALTKQKLKSMQIIAFASGLAGLLALAMFIWVITSTSLGTIIILLPIFAVISYLIFGVNRILTKSHQEYLKVKEFYDE